MSDHIDTDVAHDEGWAIAIISNVDAPEVGWPHQTEEWRTAARSWLDAVHAPAPVGLTEVRINIAGDALMTAWAIIANAWEGDWSQAPDEWRAAAERWRDEDFHPLLDALQEDDHD